MSTHTTSYQACDRCDKRLATHNNELRIATDRFTVTILDRYSNTKEYNVNNENQRADLCQTCAVLLLKDALDRVKAGERTTAGTESSVMERFV